MAPLTRREFVEGTTAAAIVAATPTGKLLAGSKPDIVDVHGGDIHKMVAAALDGLGGIKKVVHPGDYVVIKPNVAFANPPEWATTTHPQTVVAVVKACLAARAKSVTVVDFPQAKGMKCLERCGLLAALESVKGVKIKLFKEEKDFKSVKVRGGVACKEVAIPKLLLSSDVLITIPQAKQHNDTGASFGLKNSMGLIWDRRIFHTTYNIHQAVADLGRAIKPDLTIVDATRALLSNGPNGPGETSEPGRIVACRNVVSADAYALTLARYGNRRLSPDDVPHIKLAGAAGLGEIDIARMNVKKVKV